MPATLIEDDIPGEDVPMLVGKTMLKHMEQNQLKMVSLIWISSI